MTSNAHGGINRVRTVIADRPPHTTWHAGPQQAVQRRNLRPEQRALLNIRCRPLVSVIIESSNVVWTRLKAGFSSDAVAASSDRTVEPVVRSLAEPGRYGSPGVRGFPRDKSLDGSSLFFIVWPFPFRLAFEDRYYGLC